MAKVVVPTLSSSGWVSEVAEKADKLLSYFFVSESSQTNLYAGSITSLPDIIRLYGHDEFELRQKVGDALRTYLGRHFDRVELTVKTKENTSQEDYGLDIEIDAIVYQDGKTYSLGRLVSTLNSSIMKIIDLNNNG